MDGLEWICGSFSRKRDRGVEPVIAPAEVIVVGTIDQITAAAGQEIAAKYGLATDTTGESVSPRGLQKMLCDAVVRGALTTEAGEVLKLGRARRLANETQRKALLVRDGGCVIPGCSMPPAACQAHHVEWWEEHHGATDIDNLALVCSRHHTEVHQRSWSLIMKDGVPWAIPRREPSIPSSDRDATADIACSRPSSSCGSTVPR